MFSVQDAHILFCQGPSGCPCPQGSPQCGRFGVCPRVIFTGTGVEELIITKRSRLFLGFVSSHASLAFGSDPCGGVGPGDGASALALVVLRRRDSRVVKCLWTVQWCYMIGTDGFELSRAPVQGFVMRCSPSTSPFQEHEFERFCFHWFGKIIIHAGFLTFFLIPLDS